MSERKGETKRQHYVPRMILRNFSRDGTRISLVVNGKRIDGASLGKQCYEDYFYGSDNRMEKAFANEEGKMSAFLGDLAPQRFASLKPEEVQRLRMFVAYQHARTKGAAEHVSKLAGALAKAVLKRDAKYGPEDLDKVEIGIENGQDETLWLLAKAFPILLDMDVKFITTDRNPGFVVSDHPVVAYNQFAEHHPILKLYPTSRGMASKGLQLFMPLSPRMVLAVFDPLTYQYGGKKSVCRAGPTDVACLNRMQAINALKCWYFHEDMIDEATLADLAKARATHPSVYEKTVLIGPMMKREDGGIGQLMIPRRNEMRLGAKLTFIRTLDGHSYDDYMGPSVPVRSPSLLEKVRDFGQRLELEVEEHKAQQGEPSKESD